MSRSMIDCINQTFYPSTSKAFIPRHAIITTRIFPDHNILIETEIEPNLSHAVHGDGVRLDATSQPRTNIACQQDNNPLCSALAFQLVPHDKFPPQIRRGRPVAPL